MKKRVCPKISENGLIILQDRYLLRNDLGQTIESPSELFERVAHAIAKVEGRYAKESGVIALKEDFYDLMASLDFLPNSPTLMNAGTPLGQLSACFVLPVEDSMEAIFEAIKNMALVHKSGGGTGFSFSKVRPEGDLVGGTCGLASGPLSFMRIFDTATEVVEQGGKRRGANMAVLRVDHPDIIAFIEAKLGEDNLTNFNLSVAVTDEFMEAVKSSGDFALINPRNKQTVKRVLARRLFEMIASAAHYCGDPGLIFLDEINAKNQTPSLGRIEGTNPCGEQPLLPYESCNLGSINLTNMILGEQIDFEKLSLTTRRAVHFLDNVIDASRFPLPKIEEATKANRKIGLGVMGFADMLIMLGIPFDSKAALDAAEEIMACISKEARVKSAELGLERGSFKNFKKSLYYKAGFKAMRNATTTTIAPTGTISSLANVSSGIEPLFGVAFIRSALDGRCLIELNSLFERAARNGGFWSEELMEKVKDTGSLKGLTDLPFKIRKLFKTAHEIPYRQHVRIQAAFQKYTDNAVSKTVNLPKEATKKDVERIFMLAYQFKCKGVTVYRDGSRKSQVLYAGHSEFKNERAASTERANDGNCSDCKT